MTLLRPIDTVPSDREFKVLCDGLLRFELGKLVQTFGSDGSDGGVDAEFNGEIDRTSGRWVFQYKFRSLQGALPSCRSWLTQRYIGSKGRASEFDKEGVKNADGYILLTNIPVTPAMVEKLKKEWRKRGHKGPLCVWDPSRLNAMLKGREHLARSWTGAKEARCLQAIILPTWQWLQAAQAASTNWMNDPLWPLAVQSRQRQSPLGAFHQSFEWKYSLAIVPRTGALHQVRADPQFHYASTIVYPLALNPFGAVFDVVERLARGVLNRVNAVRDEVTGRLPQLEQLGDETARVEAATALAYCVLESRWGYPMRGLHSIRDGKLLIHARYYAWDQAALPDIEAILDELVRAVPHGEVDAEVVAARAAVEKLVEDWWRLLWQVVSFGIDADDRE